MHSAVQESTVFQMTPGTAGLLVGKCEFGGLERFHGVVEWTTGVSHPQMCMCDTE